MCSIKTNRKYDVFAELLLELLLKGGRNFFFYGMEWIIQCFLVFDG